jgi:catechol 2,3-dioxygenase
MKKYSTQRIWNLFLFIGFVSLGIWTYWQMQSPVSQTHSITPKIEEASGNTIPPIPTEQSLAMGVVELSVQNLSRMAQFYSDVVWFDIISTGANIMNLGDKWATFLRLIEEKNYTQAQTWEAGLYHIAITHNARKDVANRVKNIITLAPNQYQWSADHTATEAFYFSDPEGNWLELYYDKPRSDWIYQDGKPVMGSSYIDTMQYIQQYSNVPTSDGSTNMWHVHLKVGNIPEAENYYRDILLFDVMKNAGNALFVSRDGYHHHLGINTWESLGAKKRTKNTYGLRSFELIYQWELYEKIRNNLRQSGNVFEERDSIIMTEDPWGNVIYIQKK